MSIDSNINSCTTGTPCQSSMESSPPNPLQLYLSSSSSSFVDDKLLHNESEKVSIISITATGQFLFIDHHPRFHSFVNDLYLFHTNY
ncbi:unnamed protein product [Rotaria sordida]|uniref:Uncharacterized protein n=1 Tax=Rotaria sordida TaxID=392033 RepID=A0A820J3W6_9BILA|nr:unnamed protein product [Rotaria sordida]